MACGIYFAVAISFAAVTTEKNKKWFSFSVSPLDAELLPFPKDIFNCHENEHLIATTIRTDKTVECAAT